MRSPYNTRGIRYTKILFLAIALLVCSAPNAQEKLELDGAITLKDSESPSPIPGTIRWTGFDFEGYTGSGWKSLTLSSMLPTGINTVSDIDGNVYRTVNIDGKVWMRENLRTSRYNDGEKIYEFQLPEKWEDPIDPFPWSDALVGAWCWYDNDSKYDVIYGKLYNWYAIEQNKLCPIGWHVPSDEEWTELIDFLDPVSVDPNVIGSQSSVSGGKMRATGTEHWGQTGGDITNASGFTGLPAGWRSSSGNFQEIGIWTYLWARNAVIAETDKAWFRDIDYYDAGIDRGKGFKLNGFSVRCVKD